MTPQNVVEMLENRGVIDKGLAYDIEQDAVHNGKDIVQVLLDYGIYTNEDEFWAQVADELGADHFDLNEFEPPPSVIALIPAGMARLYGAFPITLDGQGLHVAFTDPLNPQLVEDLRFGLEKTIVPVVARRSQVQNLIEKHYGSGAPSIDEIFGQLGKGGKDAGSPEAEANSAPIVKFVDLVMHQAIKERASDIHFEPFEREFKIRYRVDGALYEMAPPPIHLATSIISRIKVMANMNIAEKRIPRMVAS
jgi:type IV pilus assembly protein PilB